MKSKKKKRRQPLHVANPEPDALIVNVSLEQKRRWKLKVWP